jgi:acetyl-CoA acetyltransferase
MAAEAVGKAIDDAGVRADAIDGIIPYPSDVSAHEIMSSIGADNVRFVATVPTGGASMVSAIGLAGLAIRSGEASNVLIFVAKNGSSGVRAAARVATLPAERQRSQLEYPFGWSTQAQWYATICRRHMETYDTTKDDLAAVALSMRSNAQLNERAMMSRRQLTRQEYFSAPMIADPYHKYDCSLETDGAAAILVTSAERARDLRRTPVAILAVASGHPESPDDLSNRKDLLKIGLTKAAPRAFARADLKPHDMNGAMIYDCFTFEFLHQLEEAGFCERGSAGGYVRAGWTGLTGGLPANTHGGLLSEAHMLGMNHVIEAVRQLRGECGLRQIRNARHIAVTGWGNLGDGSIAILRGNL